MPIAEHLPNTDTLLGVRTLVRFQNPEGSQQPQSRLFFYIYALGPEVGILMYLVPKGHPEVSDLILQRVPDVGRFQELLALVRHWAQLRGVVGRLP